MEQHPNEPLLREIEAFCAERGISASAFGMQAAGDPRLLHDMRKRGRELRFATVERIKQFMEAAE